MKVALIGCGEWGKNLARVFHELGVLGMVCDPALPKHGYPVPDGSFDRALKDESITAVAIAAPAHIHGDIAAQALLYEKDVFVEKPMASSVSEGEGLVRLAKNRGLILMVGHVMEYHPAVQEMLRQMQGGELGDIQYVYSHRLQSGRVREHEDVLWSFAPHDISVLVSMLGMPEEVSVHGGRHTASVHLNFGSKVPGHIFVSWQHPYKQHQTVVMGTKKSLSFDGTTLSQTKAGASCPSTRDAWPYTEPLMVECQAFVEACETRERPLADGKSGVRVLKVLSASTVSMTRNGAWMEVPQSRSLA